MPYRIVGACYGTLFMYGFARQMRSDIKDELYSTRCLYSIGNGLLYGGTIIIPVVRLVDRIQIHCQGLDPEKYPNAYAEFCGNNRNVIL